MTWSSWIVLLLVGIRLLYFVAGLLGWRLRPPDPPLYPQAFGRIQRWVQGQKRWKSREMKMIKHIYLPSLTLSASPSPGSENSPG